MNTPDSADCASSVALGNVMRNRPLRALRLTRPRRPPGTRIASLHLQRGALRRVLLGIDGDPASVLHLLDAHQVVAVVARAVEAQLALDGVDAGSP